MVWLGSWSICASSVFCVNSSGLPHNVPSPILYVVFVRRVLCLGRFECASLWVAFYAGSCWYITGSFGMYLRYPVSMFLTEHYIVNWSLFPIIIIIIIIIFHCDKVLFIVLAWLIAAACFHHIVFVTVFPEQLPTPFSVSVAIAHLPMKLFLSSFHMWYLSIIASCPDGAMLCCFFLGFLLHFPSSLVAIPFRIRDGDRKYYLWKR